MLGIPRFMSQKLKNGTKYNHSLAALITYKNKIFIQGRHIENIENCRRYSTHSFYIFKRFPPTLKCALSLSTDVSQIPTMKRSRSRIWKYLLGLGGFLGGFFFYYTTEEEDDDDDEHTNSGLPVPSKVSEVTKDWIESILSEYESQNSEGVNVKVMSFEVGNALKPGEGLNSQLLKLDVNASIQTEAGSGSVLCDKEYHMMIKMPDRSKAMTQAMNRYLGSELKELTLYSEVIPELNKFQEVYGDEFRIKVPTFIYGKYTNKDSILVMENGKSAGYIPQSTKQETDLAHAKVLVENLAKLHAVSYAYNKTHNFLDKFPCYKEDGIMNNFCCHFNTDVILDNLIKVLLLKDDTYSKELAVKIKNSKGMFDEKVRNVMRDNDSKIMMCLTHADCHNSNLLFKYDESIDGKQKIDDFKFIDWQFSHWNSPIIDLQSFFFMCMSREFRKAHLETLLEHYHSIFTEATSRMGTPTLDWTYGEFKKEYERFSGFGLIKGMSTVQLLLSKLFEVYQKGALEETPHCYPRIEKLNAKLFKHFWNQLFTNRAFEKIILSTLTALMMSLIGREIAKETNPNLNERVYGLILDADEQGLFDNNDADKTQSQTQSILF